MTRRSDAWSADLARCAEARALASCQVDGELSELDALRLDRHVAACPACAAWRAEAGSIAVVLQNAEPVVPSRSLAPRLGRRVRRSFTVAATLASATAAAGLAALIVALPTRILSLPSSGRVLDSGTCAWCMSHATLAAAYEGLEASQAPVHVVNPVGRPIDTSG